MRIDAFASAFRSLAASGSLARVRSTPTAIGMILINDHTDRATLFGLWVSASGERARSTL